MFGKAYDSYVYTKYIYIFFLYYQDAMDPSSALIEKLLQLVKLFFIYNKTKSKLHVQNKFTKMHLKYIYYMLSILQKHLHIYVL